LFTVSNFNFSIIISNSIQHLMFIFSFNLIISFYDFNLAFFEKNLQYINSLWQTTSINSPVSSKSDVDYVSKAWSSTSLEQKTDLVLKKSPQIFVIKNFLILFLYMIINQVII
jgi:hypothetical protein